MENNDNNPFAERERKEHKTLSSKLRKKREELKKHKRQKKLKKEQYARDEKRKQFFEQSKGTKRDITKDSYGVRVTKLRSLLRKFTRVYEDELQDFYELWAALDQGGSVDISGVEDPNVRECLQCVMDCLGLENTKDGYKKGRKHKQMNLKSYLKLKLQEVMEDYIENGTEESEEEVLSEKEAVVATKQIKSKPQPKQPQPKIEIEPPRAIGPFISKEQRQQMEKMLQQSCKALEQEPKSPIETEEPTKVDPRVAKGSGQMAQRTQQDAAAFMAEYNKKYRSSSLLEQHRQTLDPNKKNKNGELTDMLRGALFFDFKDKLVKPKDNKSFI